MHAKREIGRKKKIAEMQDPNSKRDIASSPALSKLQYHTSSPGFSNFEEIEDLVAKRRGEVSHLRRCILHDINENNKGTSSSRRHFLNVSPAEGTHRNHIDQIVSDEQARCFFLLGLSLGKLLEMQDPHDCVNALSQLLEEFSYFTASGASRALRRKIQIGEFEINKEDPVKVGIVTQGGQVVFQFFDTPRVPQFVDRRQVLHGICSIVFLLYNRFLEVPEERFRKHLCKLDSQISKFVLTPVVDTLAVLSKCESAHAFHALLGTLERAM